LFKIVPTSFNIINVKFILYWERKLFLFKKSKARFKVINFLFPNLFIFKALFNLCDKHCDINFRIFKSSFIKFIFWLSNFCIKIFHMWIKLFIKLFSEFFLKVFKSSVDLLLCTLKLNLDNSKWNLGFMTWKCFSQIFNFIKYSFPFFNSFHVST